MKIWAHTIVRNEERYVWFSIMSVINYVDKVLVYDTGSSDNTFEILKILKKNYPQKIILQEVGKTDINTYTHFRQEMLERTNSDWFMILDGDEVWWYESIDKVVKEIEKNGNNLDTIINRYYNIIGDLYHYQEEAAGMYEIDGNKGHLTIRTMNRKIPGLHTKGAHGVHGYYDKDNILIQERSKKRRKYLDGYYMHFTNMIRSGDIRTDKEVPKRGFKFKHELGKEFPLEFYYPEVFFLPRPKLVSDPWEKMSKKYVMRSMIETPIKKLKRRIGPSKVGY